MIIFFNHDKWDVIAVLMVYASQLVVFIYNHSGGDNFGVSSCRWTLSWQRANNNNLPELNVTRLVLQLSLPNPMKPGVKSRMKM